MKKLFTALVALVLSLSVSAQFYIYCSNGSVLKVDSINLVKPDNSNNQINNPEYVDLGLPSGLKWATCNVGAAKPEDYGDYFAWGEVEPKEYYDWSTYKYGSMGDKFTKYCPPNSYAIGIVDHKTVLDPEDDAATANWGGAWRMPTIAEQEELINNCTWTWTTQNGVNGYKVTGPNGNSIFLPAVGGMSGGTLCDAGSDAHYWSSSLSTVHPGYAYGMYFTWGAVDRCDGCSVRPVCQ